MLRTGERDLLRPTVIAPHRHTSPRLLVRVCIPGCPAGLHASCRFLPFYVVPVIDLKPYHQSPSFFSLPLYTHTYTHVMVQAGYTGSESLLQGIADLCTDLRNHSPDLTFGENVRDRVQPPLTSPAPTSTAHTHTHTRLPLMGESLGGLSVEAR